MKIGILTLPLHTNYGGILQAYALQTVLERMGHEVFVIQRPWRQQIVWWKYPLQIIKRCISRYILGRNSSIFSEIKWNKNQAVIERNTKEFIDEYIHTHQIKQISDIKETDFDTIVVGSDQIWRPKYYRLHYKYIEDAFLSFTKKWSLKRIAYAPSFGTDEWEYNQVETQKCSNLLQKFDAVSVREQSGIELCEKYLGHKNVQWVLDPTMLLNREDYERLISKDTKAPGDLMCYVLDANDEINNLIAKIANENDLKVFQAASDVDNVSLPKERRIQPPVESWLAGFRDAKLVITDSFHACVFSILFHKPFVVLGNKNRGYSRFESLLKRFGLEGRLIENASQLNQSMLNPLSVEVYKKLDDFRSTSTDFIAKALNC